MSKPRVTAQHEIPSTTRHVLCSPSPESVTPAVEVRVEFDHGDHERALSRLRTAVTEVELQIAESHAPLWGGPRVVS